jgi:hypothetical protein
MVCEAYLFHGSVSILICTEIGKLGNCSPSDEGNFVSFSTFFIHRNAPYEVMKKFKVIITSAMRFRFRSNGIGRTGEWDCYHGAFA